MAEHLNVAAKAYRAVQRVGLVHPALVHVFIGTRLEGTPRSREAEVAVAVCQRSKGSYMGFELGIEDDLVAVTDVVARTDVDVRVVVGQAGAGNAAGSCCV